MLALRLKKTGKKKSPEYRVVIMEKKSRRDGRSIDEIGYYNPITKKIKLNFYKLEKWLSQGVKPTYTVYSLLHKYYDLSDTSEYYVYPPEDYVYTYTYTYTYTY